MAENGGKFKDMTPDEMIDYQKNCDNGTRYDILDVVQRYVLSLRGKAANTKRNYYRMVRSFFAHNRAELPNDKTFIIKSDIPKVKGNLTIENVRDLANRSKHAYKAVFLSMFQGGMGLEEFEYWNLHGYPNLVKQINEGKNIIRINQPGRKSAKNDRPYYTLIGGDAFEAIKDYLPHRPEGTAIFYNQMGGQLLKGSVWHYWRRSIEAMGLIKKGSKGTANRYGLNPHEIRDLFRSQWEKSSAKGSVAEYMMGHQVDPLEYNKAFRDEGFTRREYKKALPLLQIMSSGRPFGQVDEEEIEDLQEKYTLLEAKYDRLLKQVEGGITLKRFRELQTLSDIEDEKEKKRG